MHLIFQTNAVLPGTALQQSKVLNRIKIFVTLFFLSITLPVSRGDESMDDVRAIFEQADILFGQNDRRHFRNKMETKSELVMRQLRQIARVQGLPDSTVIILVDIVHHHRAGYFIQELIALILKESAVHKRLPETVKMKIQNVLANKKHSTKIREIFANIVIQQIQTHSVQIIDIKALEHILSDEKEHIDVKKAVMYILEAWAKKFPLPSSTVVLMGEIVVFTKRDVHLRKIAAKSLAEGIKNHLLPEGQMEAFMKIMQDKTEMRSTRSSVMSVFVQMLKHNFVRDSHFSPNLVIQNFTKIIYDRRETKYVKEGAISSFIEIMKNPALRTSTTLDTLKYIMYDSGNAVRTRESAGLFIMSEYPDKSEKMSVFANLRQQCKMIF